MRSINRSSTRRRDRRQLRAIVLIAIAFTIPALAASMSQAVVPPVVVNAKTLDDGNGQLDKVQIVFSTSMNQSVTPKVSAGPGSPGFRVAGYTITGFSWVAGQTLDILLAEKDAPDTGVVPVVSYDGPEGGAENTLGEELAPKADLGATDGAGPVLVSVTAKDLGGAWMFNAPTALGDSKADEMIFTFSEDTRLAGANKSDRWTNFEKAIKFQAPAGEQATCSVDGISFGNQVEFNFPQPNAGVTTSPDIFVENFPPVNGFSQVFHVRKHYQHFSSSRTVPGIPTGCEVGIDELDANRALLTDAANNIARKRTEPESAPQKLRIQPMDIEPVEVRTRDFRGAGASGENPNGILDTIEVIFAQPLDVATISQPFAISLNGAAAIITAKELKAGDPKSLLLSFTPPAGSSWGTGVTPTVSYTRPQSCSASDGEGMKADLGGPWRACIASFSGPATDGAGPVLVDSVTLDQNLDGTIDAVELFFNEAIADTPNRMVGWTVNGATPLTFTVNATDPRRVVMTFTGGGSTDALPTLVYAPPGGQSGTMDAAGTQALPVNAPVARDGAAPRIVDVGVYDVNGDGNVDRALIEYSEFITDPSTGSAFSIGGNPGGIASSTAGTPDPGAANDQYLLLAVNGLIGTDAKEVVYTPGASPIRDAANNAVLGQTLAAAEVTDAANPVGTLTIEPSAPIGPGVSTIVVTYSEAMNDAIDPTISFVTESGSKTVTAIGWNEGNTAWEGTVTIVGGPTGDCTVPTGCPVTVDADDAEDAVGNIQGSAATLGTEIDTMAPAAPTLGSFSAHFDGRQAPANTFNMFTDGFSLGGSFAPADATGGRLELLVDGEPMDPAAQSALIGGSDTEATTTATFADPAALQEAIAAPLDGVVTLTLRLCDDALNCASSATGLDVTVDYTPVTVALSSPAGGESLQPGATQAITWDADETDAQFQSVALRFSANGGSTYQAIVGDLAADGTHQWTVPFANTTQARVAAVSIDANGNEAIAESGTFSISIDPTFADVPASYWAFESIEKVYAAGITSGCTATPKYCPNDKVTRAQMAVFLLKAMNHDDHLVAYRGMFSDVPADAWYARYVEHMADHGITGGCSTGKFCPNAPVTRAQMAAFILRAIGHGSDLPSYQGTFADVPSSAWYRPWVEHLYQHGIAGGCSTNPLKYCPSGSVTRAQMAVFIAKAWNL